MTVAATLRELRSGHRRVTPAEIIRQMRMASCDLADVLQTWHDDPTPRETQDVATRLEGLRRLNIELATYPIPPVPVVFAA